MTGNISCKIFGQFHQWQRNLENGLVTFRLSDILDEWQTNATYNFSLHDKKVSILLQIDFFVTVIFIEHPFCKNLLNSAKSRPEITK